MNPIIHPHFKILREHIMRHNCLRYKVAQTGLKLPICTVTGFLWKLTNVTIAYLLCSIMQKCFNENLCDRSWDIRLNNSGPILVSKGMCAIFPKYLKIWAKIYKIWKILKNGSVMCATITCMKYLEYILWFCAKLGQNLVLIVLLHEKKTF